MLSIRNAILARPQDGRSHTYAAICFAWGMSALGACNHARCRGIIAPFRGQPCQESRAVPIAGLRSQGGRFRNRTTHGMLRGVPCSRYSNPAMGGYCATIGLPGSVALLSLHCCWSLARGLPQAALMDQACGVIMAARVEQGSTRQPDMDEAK